MRKYIKYKVLGLALIVVGMVACDTASQEVEPVISPDGYPTAVLTPTSMTCTEGDTLYFSITTDKPIERSITFTFKQNSGTATEDDYTVTTAVLQPYTTSVEMMLITVRDWEAEPAETIVGEIGVYSIADRYLLNPNTLNPTPVSITINNYVGPTLIEFTWAKDIVVGGTAYSTSNNVDFDFFYADAEGFDFADPWLTAIDYAAGSSSHPETYLAEGLPDGSYYFVANLWNNEFASEGLNIPIPITTTFTRQGTTFEYVLVQSDEEAMSSDQVGYTVDKTDFNMVLFRLTVNNGQYTIFDVDGTNLGTYKKSAAEKAPRLPLVK